MSTGIAGLDKALDGGLHAGLTVLGAVSSMGKTSLMLQMADTLAAAGRNVLFITIEMSRMELIAKSAVRGTKERARPLLDGRLPENKVRSLISVYRQKTGGRVELWEPDAPLTPTFWMKKCRPSVSSTKARCCFWITCSLSHRPHGHDREADRRRRRRHAQAAGTPVRYAVVAASSLNREAYRPGSAERDCRPSRSPAAWSTAPICCWC